MKTFLFTRNRDVVFTRHLLLLTVTATVVLREKHISTPDFGTVLKKGRGCIYCDCDCGVYIVIVIVIVIVILCGFSRTARGRAGTYRTAPYNTKRNETKQNKVKQNASRSILNYISKWRRCVFATGSQHLWCQGPNGSHPKHVLNPAYRSLNPHSVNTTRKLSVFFRRRGGGLPLLRRTFHQSFWAQTLKRKRQRQQAAANKNGG